LGTRFFTLERIVQKVVNRMMQIYEIYLILQRVVGYFLVWLKYNI
jgi:hypothetical protein